MWSWTGSIQKRVCRYLLQRYLGQYLQEKITLAQLTIDLYNGTGTVKNVSLDCHALNGLAEQHNLPIEFIEGHLETISVSVPWSTIMQDSCEIEITGLQVTIQPKKRVDNGGSMLDSMFTSMASSMQLAEECLKTSEEIEEDEEEADIHENLSGLEHCAQTIDAVLSRVKMCFRDTVLRVEKYQGGSDIGVALEFHIKLWRYSDESCQDTREDSRVFDSAFSHKKITLEGVTCYSDIYGSQQHHARMEASQSESDPSDETEQNNSVLIANFSGRHEVGLQVKMDDSMGGPQISVDCSFGSVIALLSPIQAHIIYKLVDEILNPAPSSSDSMLERRSCKEKPMDSFDFKRVEEELQEQLKPGVIGLPGLTQQQGWSSACYDDSDEEFQPLKTASKMYRSSMSNFMNASVTSMNSSMQQSTTESLVSSTLKSSPYTYPSPSGGNTSSSTEKTKFTLSFASAAVILLHEDILTLSSKDAVLPDTLKEMRDFSRSFFQSLSLFGASVKGQKDVDDVREKMNSACGRSHHRVIAAPIKIEGLVQGTNSITETHGHLTLGYCEILESLRDQKPTSGTPNPESIEVLTFPRNFDHGNNSQSVKLEFKVRSYKGRTSTMSDTTLRFRLQECHCEFDMSIVDRINSLLNSKLPYYTEVKLDPGRSQFLTVENKKTQSVMKISVKCPIMVLNFRFPIPDLRPMDDANRVAYWIRNVQNDSIVLQLNELEFVTVLNSAVELLKLDTQCHEARLFYKDLPREKPVLFATALADDPQLDNQSLRSQGLDWPRLLVWIYPEMSSDSSGESENTDNEGDSIADDYIRRNKEPSPFSSKRIVHETLSSQEDENSHSARESVIPGDRSEMNEFIEAATKNTLFKVELNLRFVEVSFPSKHLFEEIYNRVGNDLLLWEPSLLKPTYPSVHTQVYSKPFNSNSFSMCKSAIRLDHDSDSEEEMNAFYTPSAGFNSFKSERKIGKKKSLGLGQSEVTFYLTIGNGIGSFYTPLQDLSGNTVPGEKGQVTLKIEQGCLFVVSSYKGNSNLGYLCLNSHKAEMHHSDLIRNTDILPRFCSELVKTIYPSDNGVLTHRGPDSTITDGGDMLSVAIRIERDPLKNLKTFKLATGIREGTLNHRIYLQNRSWFTQVTDFFDVTDTPVIGYTPSSVLTELHLHLWNCAVDYMPLNLSLRSILTMETFSISSNIAAQTSTSVIRFMSEDAAFYLTTKLNSNDLRTDYVCVMDMDFFELCLRLCANRSSLAPRIDLTASSNVLHIRTCSDSFKSLLELLTYYNNDGDLVVPCQKTEKETEKVHYSPIKESSSEPALITTEEIAERVRRMSVSQTEHVHDLVADAMQDYPPDSNGNHCFKDLCLSKKQSKPLYELHFRPDANENEFKLETDFYNHEESTTSTPLPSDPIMESSNGFPIEIHPSDEDDEEFCILENDPGVGIVAKNGEPEARVLIDEPIRLIENYFSPPVGKMDILKAPKRYPKPVMKYSLKEMSIIWHLYGGEDFGTSPSRKSSGKTDDRNSSEMLYSDSLKEHTQLYYDQSEVDIAIDALNPGVVFSKTKAFESAWEAYESPKNQRKLLIDGCTSWRRLGGKGRNREVLVEMHLIKIKLVHELYPETTEQASRQVIVINNVEILDKLRSSQFNKMMHLYTSPTRPKQTHANMIMIKAAHVRPDPQLNMEECSLKISILPLRLNIDQDALLFIYQFFSDLSVKSDLDDDEIVTGRLTNPPSHTPSVESLPVMTVNLSEGDGQGNSDGEDASNLLMFNDDPFGMEDNASTCSKDPSTDSTKPASPIYFRQVIFSPEVPIRLDYRGKRMDMTHGPLAGILMGLAQLNCSEIRLKRISHPHGILGFDKLAAFLINDWAVDIKKNQLPSLLGGVGPLHSFVQLFQGVRDLLWLPIEQYQKDGRIAKGLQRGVNAFSTSTAMAALELTNKFIQTIQGAAEFTYDMVSPGPSVHQKRRQSSSKRRKRYRQPGDIREGMNNAYNVVKEGLGDTAQTIVRVASKEHEQKGISGAVGGVLRQIPPTMVRPIIVVAEATSNVLDGFRSQLEPEFKKENEEKWKET